MYCLRCAILRCVYDRLIKLVVNFFSYRNRFDNFFIMHDRSGVKNKITPSVFAFMVKSPGSFRLWHGRASTTIFTFSMRNVENYMAEV